MSKQGNRKLLACELDVLTVWESGCSSRGRPSRSGDNGAPQHARKTFIRSLRPVVTELYKPSVAADGGTANLKTQP